jgi:hypothetical protein
MPLSSRRFAANPTLVACVDAGYRMHAGEADTTAVTLVQQALADLGYPCGVDGQFGDGTGTAVSAFKTDEGLSPTDPVVGSGTMQRLDGYYAAEPADPDLPDAGMEGLVGLAEAAMATAVGWVRPTIDTLLAWVSDELRPEDPAWVAREALLTRHLGIDASTAGARRTQVIDDLALPVLHAVVRALAPPSPFLVLDSQDRATFVRRAGAGVYAPAAMTTGVVFTVTPAFRNVWDDTQRAGALLRAGVTLGGPQTRPLAYPISARYSSLDPGQRPDNRLAYVCLAFEAATGQPAPFRPVPSW